MEKTTTKILLDTSFLIECVANNVDWKTQIERECGKSNVRFVVLPEIVHELRKLSTGRSKRADIARIALLMIEKSGFLTVDGEETARTHADEVIIEAATRLAKKGEKGVVFVATQDRELRRALRERGILLIVIRQKSLVTVQKL